MKLCEKLRKIRLEKGLTQNDLATKLYVSYQAVSQWENGTTTPDISTLVKLAQELDISLDELFELNPKLENVQVKGAKEETLYILLVKGNQLTKLIDYQEYVKHDDTLQIEYDGDIKDIYSHFSITVKGDVNDTVAAGDSVTCGNVGKNVSAGDSVTCGNVDGSVSAGDSVACGNVGGTVTAGDGVACGNIDGNVRASEVNAYSINGSVDASVVNIKKEN